MAIYSYNSYQKKNEYNISLEQLAEFYQLFNRDSIDYLNEGFKDIPANVANKISSEMDKKVKSICQGICKKFNADYSSISKDVDQELNKMKSSIKDDGLTNTVVSGAKRIGRILSKILIGTDDFLQAISDEIDINDRSTLSKVGNALALLFAVMLVSSILMTISIAILGPAIGTAIFVAVIGPAIEEIGKQVSERGGYGGIYNIVFNITEFSMYTSNLLKVGGKLGRIVVGRLIGVAMHSVNQLITWIANNPEVGKKLGLKYDTEEDRQKNRAAAFYITWAIHALWNTFSLSSGGRAMGNWMMGIK